MNTLFRNLLIVVFAIGTAVGPLTGCEQELETVVIKPDSKRFYYFRRGNDEASSIPCGCFHTHGLSCDGGLTADDSTIVGYSHRNEPGTQPCPCWWYVNCVYRGHVGFDVSKLEETGIVSAILRWQPHTRRSAGATASNTGNCIAAVYQATEPWQEDRTTAGEKLAWTFASEADAAPAELDVSLVVRGWLNGTEANYGFFFVGPNENAHARNNNVCLTTLTDLRLEAVVSVAQ